MEPKVYNINFGLNIGPDLFLLICVGLIIWACYKTPAPIPSRNSEV